MPPVSQQVQQAPEPTGADASAMSAFLATYGAPPEEKVEKPEPETELGEPEFDAETLDALGLIPSEGKPEAEPKETEGGADGGVLQVDLGAIAKAIGVDESDLAFDAKTGVTVRTKVDGEEATVSLGELRKGYQLQAHFTKQQEAFLAEKAAFESEKARQTEELGAQATLAMQVLDEERRQLDASYTLDWDKLREEDPAEWSARIVQYNQAVNRIEQKKARMTQGLREQAQKYSQEQAQVYQRRVQEESQALVQALGWKDQDSAREGAKKIQEYLTGSMGFSPEDLQTVVNHKAYVLADKARRYDEIMAKVSLAKKKVSEAPVVPAESGSSSTPTRAESSRKQTKTALAKLRQDHSVDSAAEVFKHLKVV